MKKVLVLLFLIGLSLSAINAQNNFIRTTIKNDNPFATGYIDLRLYDNEKNYEMFIPQEFIYVIRRVTAPYEKAPFSFLSSIDLKSIGGWSQKFFTLQVNYRMTGSGALAQITKSYSLLIPTNAISMQELRIDPGYQNVWLNGVAVTGREMSQW